MAKKKSTSGPKKKTKKASSKRKPTLQLLPVYDPKLGKVVDELTETPLSEIPAIFQRIQEGSEAWAQMGFKKRAQYLKKVRDYILDHLEEMAQVISKDNGKSPTEAILAELFPIVDLIQYYLKQTPKILADEEVPIKNPLLKNKRSFVTYKAKGPVLVISPWNYPFSIPIGEIIFALLVGNGVVLKASSETPLVGLEILRTMRAAGIPDSVFELVLGSGRTVGEALLDYPFCHISFTGSVGVGKHIMQRAAEHLTPVKMELGGKDAMLVLSNADLERAANGAVWGAFTNAGQTCAAVERVYVLEEVADAFIAKVVQKTQTLRHYLDSPTDYEIGPMTVKSQYDIVLKQIKEAQRKKANILTGGLPPKKAQGWFIPPTVITGVDHSFHLMHEETFGPLLPIMRVSSVEEAIHLANDSVFGLTASVWTKNLRQGIRVARQIEAGTVTINDHLYTHGLKETPWMGIKESGFGVSHSKWGLKEMSRMQHINYDLFPPKKNLWWFPYGAKTHQAMLGAARFSGRKSLPGLWQVLKLSKKMFGR